MKLALALLFCMHGFPAPGVDADPKFPVSDIPADLTKNVNAVIRQNDRSFRIIARDRATYHVHSAITILNEQGKSFATEVVGYDKLTKVRDISGSVYDAGGKLIKRLKASEIYDQSAFDGVTLFSDNRLKAIDLRHGSYPYTVEFEYELELRYLFHIPRFTVVSEDKISVQSASFALEYPSQLRPKYKLQGTDQQPESVKIADTERLVWDFRNVMPVRQEPHGPGLDDSPRRFLQHLLNLSMPNTWDR